jgi:hypothetical protein
MSHNPDYRFRERTMRRAKTITAIGWVVSWFFLHREIYVWHHVTPSLRLLPPAPIPGLPPPRPGAFLIAVLITAPLAPLAFFVLIIVDFMRKRRSLAL